MIVNLTGRNDCSSYVLFENIIYSLSPCISYLSCIHFSISSAEGKVSTSSLGTKSDNLYSLTPIGLSILFNVYSAVSFLRSLQIKIPMDGLSD